MRCRCRKPAFSVLPAVALVGLSQLLCSAEAAALRAYNGKIVLIKRRAPARFSTKARFRRFLRINRQKFVWPDNGKRGDRWTLRYFAFFKRMHRDVEVKVKFFDITARRRFVAGDAVFLAQRGQRILSSSIVLRKPRFALNRKYTMYITDAANVVLASTVFWLRGQGKVYSGRVTFTEEDTRKK